MTGIIDIREFRGVFTAGDPEDLPPEYLTVLQNVRPLNGKLLKTFGMGERTDIPDLPVAIHNLAAFVNANAPHGYYYLAAVIDGSCHLTVYYWDEGDAAWSSLTLPETIHQRCGTNPVVQAGGIVRFLPGNAGTLDSSEAKGLWYGWIDRDLFDGQVSATPAFFACVTNIAPPTLSCDIDVIACSASGFVTGDSYYYRFSYIYDGVQESMLSEGAIKWVPEDSITAPCLNIDSFLAEEMNVRVTGIRVYRARFDAAAGTKSPYTHIQTIDFLREAGDVVSGTDGCYRYDDMIVIPALESETFDAGKSYTLSIDGGGYQDVDNPGAGTGHFHFHFTSYIVAGYKWNVSWAMKEDGIAWKSGSTGGYCAQNGLAVIGEALPEDDVYTDGILSVDSGTNREYAVIDKAVGRVLHFDTTLSAHSNVCWKALSQSVGTYLLSSTISDPETDPVEYAFFDTALPDGAEHPLYADGEEKSIRVNGEFARIIGGRLWQGNVVLDPGGKDEAHGDWVSYSEQGQYDVNPVSNVLYCEDREGGPVTGIAEVFGCPVVLKKQAIIFINIKEDLNDPSKWTVKESAHNIGSLAKRGYIEANGSLYVCWTDAIYRLSPNNLADSDATPTERLKVTGAIEDVYQALTLSQKEAVRAAFDPSRGEIVFALGDEVWALNADTGAWREITTAGSADIFAADENGQVLACDTTEKNIRTLDPDTPESVGVSLRTKTFRISDIRGEVVRDVWVTYRSGAALTLNAYADGSPAVSKTAVLPAQTTAAAYRVRLGIRARTLALEITGPSGTTDVEIHRIKANFDHKES